MGAIFFPGKIRTTNGQIETPIIECLNASASIPPFPISENANYGYYLSFSVDQSDITPNVTYIPKTPLTISVEGVIQEPWYSIITTHDGNYHNIFTLSNGYSCEAKYERINSRLGSLYIIFKDNHGTIINTGNQEYFAGSIKPDGTIENPLSIGMVIVQDETTGKIFGATYNAIVYSTRFIIYYGNLINGTNRSNEGFFDGSIVPDYAWEPVPQLSGNSGQFRIDLSQVKAEYIGDGLTQDSTSDGSRFVISDMALLRTLTNNCAVGDEVTVGYCGRNYLTFTRDSADTRSGVFKFYYYNGLLAYTSPLFVVNPGTTTFVYLCMYKDVVEHAAMMQIISYYVANDPYYTYNHLYDTYGATEPTDNDMIALWIWLSDNGNIEEDINPYDTGTTDDGGDPGNPRPQDRITDSPLPTLSGLESGIVTLYRPTATQLTQISAFLWSNDVLDNFKKYFNNFADNILSLSIMPFTPSGLSTKLFKVGNMQSLDIGQIEYSTQRFFDIPMGSVNINKLWGSYLDYSPYTKCEIYLPYLGLHSLDIDELMSPCKLDGSMPATQGCTLTLTYRLDILTGVIVAKIAVTNEFITDQIRYQFSGKCGASIPLTGQTYAQLVQSIATIGAGLISTVATSGMAAPMIAGAAAVAATVQSQKPSVERIGNISGDASMLATNVPYIILSSPNKALLEKQEEFTGFPSYKSGTLQNFTGYCEVIDAHVEGITCTEEERAEILSLLKAGAII